MAPWQEEYKRRYARLKEAGRPFFPYTVIQDAVVAFLVFGALAYLAWHVGAGLEELADPTDSTYNPRPEWYFLFLFQALKYFPGRLEPVAAVLLPGLTVVLLALVPFLDRGPVRHPLARPFWTGLGAAALAGFCYLTWAGYSSPMTNPVVARDPLVLSGQRLYGELRCVYCHRISGRGGSIGPELDKTAGDKKPEWLAMHFRDPQALVPGSAMPKLNLLEEEIRGLVAYLGSLEGAASFSPEAPKVFAANCAVCHKIGQAGGEAGPDLSQIGAGRDRAYIKRYIESPAVVNPASSMPGFQGQLTDVQIEDVSRYLSTLGSR